MWELMYSWNHKQFSMTKRADSSAHQTSHVQPSISCAVGQAHVTSYGQRIARNDVCHFWPKYRIQGPAWDTLAVYSATFQMVQLQDGRIPLAWAPEDCVDGGLTDQWRIWSTSKLLHLEWINNKVLLYSTGNHTEYPVINHNGKEYKKRMSLCITESLCCTAEIGTAL